MGTAETVSLVVTQLNYTGPMQDSHIMLATFCWSKKLTHGREQGLGNRTHPWEKL